MAEQFVDEEKDPIPPQSTWDTLTANQLLEIKIKLETRLYEFRTVPQMTVVLKRSIEQLDRLINAASSHSF